MSVTVSTVVVTILLSFTKLAFAQLPGGSLGHFYNASLECQHDAWCPEGLPWSNEIDSVIRFTTNWDGWGCTGTLLNNTAEELIPYLLISNHCTSAIDEVGDQAWYLIQFHWERGPANCNDSSSTAPDYEYGYFQVEATSAGDESYAEGDYVLLKFLNGVTLNNIDVHYASWSRLNVTPQMEILIGHPRGDVKKLVVEDDPVLLINDERWEITDQEIGITEIGNSGSPLFDEGHYFVGHTRTGGNSECDPPIAKPGGTRIFNYWDSTSPSLGSILDAGSTGATSILPLANYDLDISGISFSDSTADLGSGFFRTALSITATDDTLKSTGKLHLRAREGLTIDGDFIAEAGGDLLPWIEPAPMGGAGKSSESLHLAEDTLQAPFLESNYPNPFYQSTTFRFTVSEEALVQLRIFDLLGREILTLFDRPQPPGHVTLHWTPIRENGQPLASGVYFYQLRIGDFVETKQLTVLR